MVPLPFNIPLNTVPKGTVAKNVDLINPVTEAKEVNKTKIYCTGGGEACAGASDCEGVLCLYEDRSNSSEEGGLLHEDLLRRCHQTLQNRRNGGA
jgi:hypothetical protein